MSIADLPATELPDPYTPETGTAGLTVEHYDLELEYRILPNLLSGRARLTARILAKTKTLVLDLTGLTASKVTVDKARVKFRARENKLVLTLPAPAKAGATVLIDIKYGGNPAPSMGLWGDVGWEELSDGVLVAGQPVGASTWFPCNDHPSNKATYRLEFTVDADYSVVSNGRLVSTKRRAGRTVFTYEEHAPLTTYLATAQIGQYTLGEIPGGPVPITLAAPPGQFRKAQERLAVQHRMIEALSEFFGPYPFDHYGVVVTADVLEIPLESQPLSIFGPNHLRETWDAERLVAHELAHQWFGNSVTVRNWRDIWMHEGFACYAEWLWSEASGQKSVAERARDAKRGLNLKLRTITVGDPGPEKMFDDRVYKRGALAVHALREAAGDEAFIRTLHRWQAEFRHANGSAEEFFALASRETGLDVAALLHPWLYQEALPR